MLLYIVLSCTLLTGKKITELALLSMADQILTVKQVAEYLQVNERTVYRMANAKKLPAFKVGVAWRFKQSEIEKWIKDQHNQPF